MSRTGKGGYFLDGQALDINPTVVLNDDMAGHEPTVVLVRQDRWQATDGTEQELRGEEQDVLEMLRKMRDNGQFHEQVVGKWPFWDI